MGNPIFPSKFVEEHQPYTVNFSDKLLFGEAINGANVTVIVQSGVDPSPAAMLVGGPTFTATDVTQEIIGGVPGVMYKLVFVVTGTGSHNYAKVGSLAVISNSDI